MRHSMGEEPVVSHRGLLAWDGAADLLDCLDAFKDKCREQLCGAASSPRRVLSPSNRLLRSPSKSPTKAPGGLAPPAPEGSPEDKWLRELRIHAEVSAAGGEWTLP